MKGKKKIYDTSVEDWEANIIKNSVDSYILINTFKQEKLYETTEAKRNWRD